MAAAYEFAVDVAQSGNRCSIDNTLASASTLVLPDAGEGFVISGSTTIGQITTNSQSVYAGKLREVIMTNNGTLYNPNGPPAVTISGDGTGATAIARVSNEGYVIGIEVTNRGSGYTSATASFAAPGGGGVTATGVAIIGLDNVKGREPLTLSFGGTMIVGGGSTTQVIGSNRNATPGTILVFRGLFGSLFKVTDNGIGDV